MTMNRPEPSQYAMLRAFDRTLPDVYDLKREEQASYEWLRRMARIVVAGGDPPNPAPRLDKKFDKAIGMLDRSKLAEVVRAEQAGCDLYRSLIDADADAIIDGLGIRDVNGFHWDELRADIRRAAAITEDGPERSRAWGAFYRGTHDPDEVLADAKRAAEVSAEDLFYIKTKALLCDLYCRYAEPPRKRWTL